jgi:hypothetical protein
VLRKEVLSEVGRHAQIHHNTSERCRIRQFIGGLKEGGDTAQHKAQHEIGFWERGGWLAIMP